MFFESLDGSIKMAPGFRWFWLDDVNPLSGHRKKRRIYSPNKGMRDVHRLLIQYIRRLRVQKHSSTGARPGSSPLKNVLRHRHQSGEFPRFFYLVDISGAYASVELSRLVELLVARDLQLAGKDHFVREFLERFCFSSREGGLIVGAPASPDLFNIYCEVLLDPQLRQLCSRYRLNYTRYLDDLTFSSSQVIGKKKRRALRKEIEAIGFSLNERKAQVLDLSKGPITVNGVGVTLEGRCFLPRHALRELRGLIHLALTGRPINLSLIHGKMGVFKALTNPMRMNCSEKRILNMYRELKKLSAGT